MLTFGWDAAGRQTSRRFGATTLDQAFDPVGRLLTQTLTTTTTPTTTPNPHPADPLLRRDYGYSIDGLLTEIDDLTGGVHRYTHDPTGQVTTVQGPTGDERYGYDPSGNLTHATWPTPATNPGGDPDPGPRGPRTYTGTLITHAGNTTYTHDRAGRLTRRHHKLLSGKTRTWTYTWDAHDRLTDVRTPDGTRWRYTYDPLGRRIAKQRLTGPAHRRTGHRDRADPVHLGRPHPRRNPRTPPPAASPPSTTNPAPSPP